MHAPSLAIRSFGLNLLLGEPLPAASQNSVNFFWDEFSNDNTGRCRCHSRAKYFAHQNPRLRA